MSEQKGEKALTADDINNILEEKFKPIPTLDILGIKVSRDDLIISGIAIAVWTLLWVMLGLFSFGKISFIFYLSFIVVQLINIFNSSIDTETSVEFAIYEFYNQVNRIEGAFGVIILVLVFLYNMPVREENKQLAYKLLTIVSILLAITVVQYDTKNDPVNIRNTRLAIQKIYNQAIILFIFTLVVIFYGLGK